MGSQISKPSPEMIGTQPSPASGRSTIQPHQNFRSLSTRTKFSRPAFYPSKTKDSSCKSRLEIGKHFRRRAAELLHAQKSKNSSPFRWYFSETEPRRSKPRNCAGLPFERSLRRKYVRFFLGILPSVIDL
jgi:hypothetical protein